MITENVHFIPVIRFAKLSAIMCFTRATCSVARYLLRQRGWLAGCHTPVLCLNG